MPDEQTQQTQTQQATMLESVTALLKEFNFEVSEKGLADLKKAFTDNKTDLMKFKGEAKGKSDIEKQLADLQAAEEQRRQATLSETERLKEEKAALEKSIADKDKAIQQGLKNMLLKETMFDALKDKPLASVRKQLYQAAASAQEWDGAEALQSIFKKVDTDLDNDLKAHKVTIPAPGDGAGAGGGTGGGETKYDADYFRNLQRRAAGVPVPK